MSEREALTDAEPIMVGTFDVACRICGADHGVTCHEVLDGSEFHAERLSDAKATQRRLRAKPDPTRDGEHECISCGERINPEHLKTVHYHEGCWYIINYGLDDQVQGEQ